MMTDMEWRHQIIEDVERLKEDVSGYMAECRKGRFDMFIPSMICKKCGSSRNRSIGTTTTDAGFRIRRRKCLGCGERWNTVEIGSYSGPS